MFTTPEELKEQIHGLRQELPTISAIAKTILSEELTLDEYRIIAELSFGVWIYDFVRQTLPPRALVEETRKAAPKTFVTPDGRRRASAREATIIDARATRLEMKELSDHGWIPFGDFTPKDLRWLASYRRDQAAEVVAEGNKFDLVADTMDSVGARRVRDMAPEVTKDLGIGL